MNVTKAETKIMKLPPVPRKARLGAQDRSMVVRMGERATKERERQQGGVVKDYAAEEANSRVMVMRHKAACECQLDVYLRVGKLDKGEFTAGMQYREAWQIKAEGIRTKDSLSGSDPVDGGRANTEEEMMKRLNRKGWSERILAEAHGEAGLTPAQGLMVTHVCASDWPVGRDFDMKTLRRGLDKLARFWNFI